jgi:hypothetical protein
MNRKTYGCWSRQNRLPLRGLTQLVEGESQTTVAVLVEVSLMLNSGAPDGLQGVERPTGRA